MVLSPVSSAVALIMIGCCSNVIVLEYIIRFDSGAGNIVTCAQFLFIALQGLSGHFRTMFRTIVPLWFYALLTAIFFSLSVANNKAYDFNISMPVHMVFRASSLAASMIVGYLGFKKRCCLYVIYV